MHCHSKRVEYNVRVPNAKERECSAKVKNNNDCFATRKECDK